ncbi:YolD-like family protein [Peribacillus frigoritolerans]|uniref:YolD-like family protein n=2 Tax=Peribacillus frigoritolerans TaxID=450367 RepID=UPI0020BE3F29|nr:YolD-like family protein [Peribacillus frigoritolerans]
MFVILAKDFFVEKRGDKMIRDRGNKKWVSLMLPEHVKMLREYDASYNKIPKPSLDEQKYEQFNEIVSEAMEMNNILEFSYYFQGDIRQYIGNIHYFDVLKQDLRIIDQRAEKHFLKLENIIGISDYNE